MRNVRNAAAPSGFARLFVIVAAGSLAACGGGGTGAANQSAEAPNAANGEAWLLREKDANSGDSFQGSATLILADAPDGNGIAFKNSRIEIRCPANWGNETNQVWSASIDIPLSTEYERGSDRGSMAIDVDGKPFNAVQFSRSTYNIKADQAEAFRDAVVAGKTISFTPKTLDGRTGTTSAALPDGAALKDYFATACPPG